MKKYSNIELVDMFYEEHIEGKIDITRDMLIDIIDSPFELLKIKIKEGLLIPFRFKYLGIFTVYKGTATRAMTSVKRRFENGEIVYEKYAKMEEAIKNRFGIKL